MKKTVSLILVLIMLFICITACSTKTEESTDDNKTSVDNTHPIDIIFLYAAGEASEGSEDLLIGFGQAGDYGINDGWIDSELKVYTELKDKLKTPFDGSKTFVYTGSDRTYRNINTRGYGYTSIRFGKFYCTYDEYIEIVTDEHTDINMLEVVRYLHGTDILTYYRRSVSEEALQTEITIEEDVLKKTAEGFALKIISKEDLSKYADGQVTYTPVKGLCSVNYDRYINGYLTDESISVYIASNGEIMYYSAPFFGKYDTLEAELTKEKLDKANKKLRNKIEELRLTNLSMGISRVVTSTSGEAFLRIPIEYDTDEGSRIGYYVYINIQ